MKTLTISFVMLAAAAPLAFLMNCGGDDTASCQDNPGGCTTTTSSSAASGDPGSGASSTSGGTGGGSTGSGGGGGGTPSNCVANPTPAEIPAMIVDPVTGTAEIKSSMTLTRDKVWSLKNKVHVRAGATLTIESCATIQGDKATLGTLIIDPGAKIMAEGTPDEPIVFTSAAPVGDRQPGDWGGVILLGQAPINVPGGKANIEGLAPTPETQYGGNKPDDNSGTIKYARIEFSGILLTANNEVNGLTLGGVGSGTTLEYIQVKNTLDDCFEFFGGAVNAKHLVCTANQDDGFDWDFGYSGKLQFLVLQQDQAYPDDTNGFESDNDAMGTTNMPISNPTIYNATLVGHDAMKQQFGWLPRRSTKGQIYNAIFTNFEACIDVRDANTSVELKSSICYGNKTNVAYVETTPGDADPVLKDDDSGFDEIAWFNDPSRKNSETNPELVNALDAAAPNFRPKATITKNAATPPSDGFFDATASYIGALKADDTWMTGKWIDFAPN